MDIYENRINEDKGSFKTMIQKKKLVIKGIVNARTDYTYICLVFKICC